MNRGEVWWTDFDPSIGSEIQKRRPAIIASIDTTNDALSRVIVVPLTTNVSRVYPSETSIVVNGKPHKAMVDQMRAVSKLRLSTQFGRLSDQDMQEVEQVLIVQLGLA